MQQQRQTEEIAADDNDNDGTTTSISSSSCWICTESISRITRSRNRTLMRGCACRGPHAGFAHLDCLIMAALHNHETWDTCPNCKQDFTGRVRLGLAKARWELFEDHDDHEPRCDWERLNACDRYASALQECSLDNEGALPLFSEVLEISREVDGDEDENTLLSMNNLAALHQKMGNYQMALPLFEEALGTQRRILGRDSPDALRTMSNLAILHLRTGNFDRALPLATESLKTRQRVLGVDHVDTLESVHNMGLLRWHMAHGEYVSFSKVDEFMGSCKLRDLKASGDFIKTAAEGYTRVLGNQHDLTKMAVRGLDYVERRIKEPENSS